MSRDDFEAPLRIEARAPVVAIERGTRPSQASRAIFLNVDLDAFSASAEPTEAFASAIDVALTNMASWLRERSPAEFDRIRARGVRLDVFIGGAIDNDQFELKLPAPFVEACGARDLPIQIVTND